MSSRIANAPCSWGVLEFDNTAKVAGWPTVLTEIASTGYAGTELGDWGFLPTEPAALIDALQQHSLTLVGGFVPVGLSDRSCHEAGRDQAVRTAKLMAAASPTAVVVLADDNGADPVREANAGRVRAEHSLDAEGWQAFADGANAVAAAVYDATGLATAFHHHCGGFIETPAEVARLMDMTDPDLLGLCLDTGHYTFGGGDPLECMRALGSRVQHVHFKDCSEAVVNRSREAGWDYTESVRRGVFCELGAGMVDFPGVMAALDAQGYDGWIVVEQDVLPGMGAPADSARRNREFARGLGL